MSFEYKLIQAPTDYPGRVYSRNRVLEHHLVWWLNTGYAPNQNEIVHHKNKNKLDNHFENLELKLRSDHSREHNKERSVLVHGTLNGYSHHKCRCDEC